MIEQDPVAGEYLVGVPVVAGEVVGVNLGRRVGALRLKGRGLTLGRRGGAEHFAGGRLVEPRLDLGLLDGLQEPQGSQTRDVAGVFRHVKAHPHVALRAEVIDFVRLDLMEEIRQVTGDAEVSVVEVHARFGIVKVPIEVIDPLRVERRGAPDEPVDLIPLVQQELGQIRAVLTGDSRDEGLLHE